MWTAPVIVMRPGPMSAIPLSTLPILGVEFEMDKACRWRRKQVRWWSYKKEI